MKNFLAQIASDASQSPKIATTVSIATTGSGISTFLEIVPAYAGTVATLMGIILSSVLIVTHLKKHKLEMRLLNRKLEEAERS